LVNMCTVIDDRSVDQVHPNADDSMTDAFSTLYHGNLFIAHPAGFGLLGGTP